MSEALLIDLDGTVYQDGRVLPGVPDALDKLRRAGVPLRLVRPDRVLSSLADVPEVLGVG